MQKQLQVQLHPPQQSVPIRRRKKQAHPGTMARTHQQRLPKRQTPRSQSPKQTHPQDRIRRIVQPLPLLRLPNLKPHPHKALRRLQHNPPLLQPHPPQPRLPHNPLLNLLHAQAAVARVVQALGAVELAQAAVVAVEHAQALGAVEHDAHAAPLPVQAVAHPHQPQLHRQRHPPHLASPTSPVI